MEDNLKTILCEFERKKDEYEGLCNVATRLLKELLKMNKIKYSSIYGRVKEKDSLENKIRIKQKYNTISDITDIIGVRIITYYTDDVDRIATIIESEFDVDKDNTIDKRKAMDPDTFGYLSLHYVVKLNADRSKLTEYLHFKNIKFEIQVRTILQHTWAEIEHDLGYKTKIEIPSEITRDFSRLAGLLELADKEFLEIKDRLGIYENKIERQADAGKISDDTMLDKVSLEKILLNDEKMVKLNNRICKILENGSLINGDISRALKYLKWIGISNVKELEKLIENNSMLAYKIAQHYLAPRKSCEKIEVEYSIGIFYLCYAELVNTGYSEREITKYFKENSIGDGGYHNSAMKLLSIYNQILNEDAKIE